MSFALNGWPFCAISFASFSPASPILAASPISYFGNAHLPRGDHTVVGLKRPRLLAGAQIREI
jgi:hypothetical protein